MKRKTLNRLGVFFLVLAIAFSIGLGIGLWRINDKGYWDTIEHDLNRHGVIDTIRKTEAMRVQFQNIIYLLVIPMVILYTLAIICLSNGYHKFKQERL